MAAESERRGRATRLTDRVDERDALDRLMGAVRAGESRVLVVRGEPGVGKTVLLDHLAGRASGAGCRVAYATGVQSEMELAFAGLHQLRAPMLNRAGRLPVPQRDALRTAFGLAPGPPPDRFFVGLAVLSLLSGVAGERPLICLIDDQQWLDQASAPATHRWYGGPPDSCTFPYRPGSRRWRPAWSSSACRSGSGIRWSARRSIGRRRSPSGGRRTPRWPKRPIRTPIPIAGPGTRPRPRPGRTSRSRRNCSGRSAGYKPAAEWPPPQRSSNGPRC